jgi:MFS family permease
MSLGLRYWGSFAFTSLACISLLLYSKSGTSQRSSKNAKFEGFQTNYITVFLLAMLSDWLQGPYVYELYVSYGFNQQQIAELFVCGFGSSMIVGTFVGGLADKFGRKFMCILYSVFYILACLTKLFNNYYLLMLGRFLSGVATSLLFSAFETWMVCEHHKQGFDSNLLGTTFSYATFGNGLIAVLAGLVANTAAKMFGFVAPFVLALFPLTIVGMLVYFTWTENYGNQQLNVYSTLLQGFEFIKNDSKIVALGIAQSCFEGAMYTFIFMWTPALKSAEENQIKGINDIDLESTSQYLGLIFAVFMICFMIGSTIFKLININNDYLYKIPLLLHFVSFFAMGIVTIFLNNKFIVYSMFLIFETMVGLFYPSYGVIKSERIPENIRSSVMNMFRMPLNAFVVVLLIKIKFLSFQSVFAICTATHAIAFVSYYYFYHSSHALDLVNNKPAININKPKNDDEEKYSTEHLLKENIHSSPTLHPHHLHQQDKINVVNMNTTTSSSTSTLKNKSFFEEEDIQMLELRKLLNEIDNM